MKKIALLILISTLFLSCKKDDPMAPESREHDVSISVDCDICFVSFSDSNDQHAAYIVRETFTEDFIISGRQTFDVKITTFEPQKVSAKVTVNGKVPLNKTVFMTYEDTWTEKVPLR